MVSTWTSSDIITKQSDGQVTILVQKKTQNLDYIAKAVNDLTRIVVS